MSMTVRHCRTSGEIFAQQMDISRLSEKLKDLIDIVSHGHEWTCNRPSSSSQALLSHVRNTGFGHQEHKGYDLAHHLVA